MGKEPESAKGKLGPIRGLRSQAAACIHLAMSKCRRRWFGFVNQYVEGFLP
jgi:hypothetical protein